MLIQTRVSASVRYIYANYDKSLNLRQTWMKPSLINRSAHDICTTPCESPSTSVALQCAKVKELDDHEPLGFDIYTDWPIHVKYRCHGSQPWKQNTQGLCPEGPPDLEVEHRKLDHISDLRLGDEKLIIVFRRNYICHEITILNFFKVFESNPWTYQADFRMVAIRK